MSTNAITSTGLSTKTATDIVNDLTTALTTTYGPNINTDADSPDGQWINIIAQAAVDNLDLLTQIYNGFNPDLALGVVLDQRVAINGIQRQVGTNTITNITITTSQALNLDGLDNNPTNPYTVSDNSGNNWQLITHQTIGSSGSYVLAFQSSVPGAVLTIPNTITVPVTIVLGVSFINNPTSYTSLGINEETDAALKIRRQKSVSLPSQGYLAGLLAALRNIAGITAAFVYENTTDAVNSDGVPGHSIWVIVSGTPTAVSAAAWSSATTYAYGNLASSGGVTYKSIQNNNTNNIVSTTAFWSVYNPIAEAIYLKRNAGCGMYNDISGSPQSYNYVQLDGSSIVIYWDLVVTVPLFIKFTATPLNAVNDPQIANIKTQLPSLFVPGVNSEVNINQLSTYVQSVDSNTLVTASGFSITSGGSYTTTLSPAAKNNQFTIISADIIILPMILYPKTSTVVHSSGTVAFSGVGGYGTLVYSISVNNSGGTINSSSGAYTAGATPGTDTILVTDAQSNTATASVQVS